MPYNRHLTTRTLRTRKNGLDYMNKIGIKLQEALSTGFFLSFVFVRLVPRQTKKLSVSFKKGTAASPRRHRTQHINHVARRNIT